MLSRKFVLLVLFVNLIIWIPFYLFCPQDYIQYNLDGKFWVGILLCVALFCLIVPFIIKDNKSLSGRYFRPLILFIIGYVIVFFQRYLDLYWGLIDKSYYVFADPKLIVPSLTLSVIGIISLLIGYYAKTNKSTVFTNKKYIFNLTTPILIFRIALLLFFIFCAKGYLTDVAITQADLEASAGGITNYTVILYRVAFMALLTLVVCNCKAKNITRIKDIIKEFGLLNITLLSISFIIILIGGRRFFVLVSMLSFIASYFYLNGKQISLLTLGIFLFLGVTLLSFIGATRENADMSYTDRLSIYEQINEDVNSISPGTVELAGSLYTFNTVLEYIPSEYDYAYGSFHFRNLLYTIPFSGRLVSSFLNPDMKYHSTDFFITYLIQGNNYSYGNGTSINADLYINYGFIGVILGLFILGLVFRKVDDIVYFNSSSPYYTYLFIFFSGIAFPYCRSGYLAMCDLLVFGLILLYCFNRICKAQIVEN